MRFGNFLLNHRIFSFFHLVVQTTGPTTCFMCVFPKVFILIMIMGGGVGPPPKMSHFAQNYTRGRGGVLRKAPAPVSLVLVKNKNPV